MDLTASTDRKSVSGATRSAVRPTLQAAAIGTSATIAPSTRWSAGATRCSTPPGRPGSATSTRRDRTGWRSNSSRAGLHARQLPEHAIVIGSKWGYEYVGGWRMDAPVHEVKDLSADALRKQYGESHTLLGSRLGLYQIHSATIERGVAEGPPGTRGLAGAP